MSNPMISFRDVALQKISKGITSFNVIGSSVIEREYGYKTMISGIEDLITYIKQEHNKELRDLVKVKLEVYLNQAGQMKQEIEQMKKQQQNGLKYEPSSNNSQDPQPSLSKKQSQKDIEKDKLEMSLSEAIITEKPNVRWDDVAGLENAKKALHEAVILPVRFPHFFEGIIKPWKGILLYGPPGTGKTYLAKACATECDATFFSISSSDLISKFVGESEKLIKSLFKMAREKKPSIIFIDEIDSMAGNRTDGDNEASRRVKTEFLVQMQGVGNDDTGVLVLGATNVPWGLDPAIRRRFEKRIMIPLPEEGARLDLINNLLNKTQNQISEYDRKELAQKTQGFSGSDISILIRDASYGPLRSAQSATHFKQFQDEDGKTRFIACNSNDPYGIQSTLMNYQGDQIKLRKVEKQDFDAALQKCKPSVSEKDIIRQDEFTKEFGEGDC